MTGMTGSDPFFSDYIVFIDESGDHSLTSIDAQFPIFVLVFAIVEKAAYSGTIIPAIKALKFRFWGHDAAVLHAHEIRKPRGDFAFLQIPERREPFMVALNEIMAATPVSLIAIVIRKDRLSQRYRTPFNPYHIALSLGLERVSSFLLDHGQEGRLTHLIAEARGDREDAELELEFRRIMDGKGMLGCNVDGSPLELRIVSKKVNSEGLQLADLFAHPIGRHALNPAQPNRAFDILAPRLLTDGDHGYDGWGLKVFP